MALLFDVRSRDQKKSNVNKFFVSEEYYHRPYPFTNFLNLSERVSYWKSPEFDFSKEFSSNTNHPGKHGQIL
jgi:glycine dehydrogenase